MKNAVERMLNQSGLGTYIDSRVDHELDADEEYNKRMDYISQTKDKLYETLNKEQRELLDEYTEAIYAANYRESTIAYMTGSRDSILFLKDMNALKDSANI